MLIEVYHLINKVERYHYSFRRAYKIVYEEYLNFYDDYKLQMIIKAINNIIGSNGFILTLLVFGVYPKITELNPLNLFIK